MSWYKTPNFGVEADENIFKGVLLSMRKVTPVHNLAEDPADIFGALDLDGVHVEPMVFTHNIRPSK